MRNVPDGSTFKFQFTHPYRCDVDVKIANERIKVSILTPVQV